MTHFYEVRDSDQVLVRIAAYETVGEDRIFEYLPNTGTWQRSTAVEDDFYAPDRAATYAPISADQAARRLPMLHKLNAKTAGWLLDDLTRSSTASSAELGLPIAATARPTADVQVIDILTRDDVLRWVTV